MWPDMLHVPNPPRRTFASAPLGPLVLEVSLPIAVSDAAIAEAQAIAVVAVAIGGIAVAGDASGICRGSNGGCDGRCAARRTAGAACRGRHGTRVRRCRGIPYRVVVGCDVAVGGVDAVRAAGQSARHLAEVDPGFAERRGNPQTVMRKVGMDLMSVGGITDRREAAFRHGNAIHRRWTRLALFDRIERA